MLRLLLILIFLTIIFSRCVLPEYVGKATLIETKLEKTDATITRVLLVGVGSTASRLFLENLSTEIIKQFERYHILCDFTYAGKIPRYSHINVNKMIAPQYDTYLVLNPTDTSYINTNKEVAYVATPLPGGNMSGSSVKGNQYIEDYYVELYSYNTILNKVWQATLKVNFDVANPGRYAQITNGIFDKLLKNGFIRGK